MGDPEDPWARPVLPPPPRRRQGGVGIAVGAVMIVLGLIGVPACLVAALLTANPCGAFSDGCSDYGQTSTLAVGFMYGVMLSAGVAIAGFVLVIVSLVSRRRADTR